MIVSKIEKQKKANRYNLYIDGKFFLGIDENVLVKYALYKGLEISSDQLEKIRYDEEVNKYYNQALNYLSYGLRTSLEMRQYLDKHLPIDRPDRDQDIEQILGKLQDQGFLDDLSYGQAYVRTKMRINRKGPILIGQELQSKGLKPSQVQVALEEYSFQQGQDNLRILAEKFNKKQKKLSDKLKAMKLQQHLQMKGYPKDWIDQVDFQEILADSIDDQDLIEDEVQKLYRKKSRKYQGSELKQAIRQSLYQKGFLQDDIDHCLEHHAAWFDTE